MKRATAAPTADSGVVRPEPARGEDRFEALARAAPIGIFECDLTGCCTFMNHVWQTIQQEPPENALGFGWLERVHPDDRGQFQPGARAFDARTDPVERRFRILRPDGELRTLRIRLAKLRSLESVHVGWSGTFEDITDALLEDEVGRAVRRGHEALIELGVLALGESDAHSLFVAVAQRALHALAAHRVEIVDARNIPLALAGQHERPVGEVLSATITATNALAARIAAMLPSGRPPAIKAVDASFLESVANLVSVWLRRQEQQRWLRAVFEHNADPVLRLRADGTILEVNSASARCVGILASELAGQPIAVLGLSERATGAWRVALEQAYTSRQGQSFEFELATAAGQVRYSARLDVVVDEAGSVESIAATLHNFSDRVGYEQLGVLQQELLDREDRLDSLVRNMLGERALLRERARTWGLAALTTREQTILRLMATGKTNRQIGAELGMSPGTVRNRISLLLPKLGAADRTQAVAIAIQSGLLETFNAQVELAPTEELPLRAFNLGEFE